MEVESQSVTREEPCKTVEWLYRHEYRPLTDEFAAAKDDEETNPDGLSKVNETPDELNCVVSTVGFLLQIFDGKTSSICTAAWDGNKEPNDSGDGEEGGGEEEAIVISKLGDGGGGSNSSGSTSDFVEDMLEENGEPKSRKAHSRFNIRQ